MSDSEPVGELIPVTQRKWYGDSWQAKCYVCGGLTRLRSYYSGKGRAAAGLKAHLRIRHEVRDGLIVGWDEEVTPMTEEEMDDYMDTAGGRSRSMMRRC